MAVIEFLDVSFVSLETYRYSMNAFMIFLYFLYEKWLISRLLTII